MKTLLDLTTRQRHWLSSRLMHPEGSYALSIVDAQAIQISQIKEVLALYRECPPAASGSLVRQIDEILK